MVFCVVVYLLYLFAFVLPSLSLSLSLFLPAWPKLLQNNSLKQLFLLYFVMLFSS